MNLFRNRDFSLATSFEWYDTNDMGSLGWQELLLILFIVLVVFGAGRVPEIFRAMGSGVGEFKKGLKEAGDEDNSSESGANSGGKKTDD